MKIQTGDYFLRSAIEKAGREVWETVRGEIRKQGFTVNGFYGVFGRAPFMTKFAELDNDGDLVWKETVNDRASQLELSDFLPKPAAAFEAVKFRTDNDADRTRVAVDHLLSLGYINGPFKAAIDHSVSTASFTGVVGTEQGRIELYQLKSTFNAVDAQEYNFGVMVERKVSIKGIEPVPVYVDVQGVKCEVKALKAFLQSQKSANQSA